jgi:hypothetical protein
MTVTCVKNHKIKYCAGAIAGIRFRLQILQLVKVPGK